MATKSRTKPLPKPNPDDVLEVFSLLLTAYPNPQTELVYEGPFQLLIAVILSAQCTDDRVNQTTPALFKAYPTPERLAKASTADVEKLIHSCGFFRAKTKALISTAKDLTDRFASVVPRTMEELTSLRGVGRKTASVVMNQAFHLPAIAVDTHVARVSRRLGWARSLDPRKIEFELKSLLPPSNWATINTLLILHGRKVCKAIKPRCQVCPVKSRCAYYQDATDN